MAKEKTPKKKKQKSVVIGKRLPIQKVEQLEKLGVDLGACIEDMVDKMLNTNRCSCCGKEF